MTAESAKASAQKPVELAADFLQRAEEPRRLHFHSLIARVAEESGASVHLNQSFGFSDVASQASRSATVFGSTSNVAVVVRMASL